MTYVEHAVKDRLDNERRNPLPLFHGMLFLINTNIFLGIISNTRWSEVELYGRDGLSDRSSMAATLIYFSFAPMFHDCGMYYHVCGMVHIKDPSLPIGE